MRTTPLAIAIVIASSQFIAACGVSHPELRQPALQAVSADAAAARKATHELREAGPAGLEALLLVHRQLLAQHQLNSNQEGSLPEDPAWNRLQAALDAVGGQRGCYTSRLYWHTDFDKALAAARQTGRPVLSLRLLGNLTDEFSCANSRFFRSTLYANAEVSAYLKQHFILHWQSVRPVPRVTIDFGDGRKLERTLTGNSVHYVLDAAGRPIDALPGLYGPRAFLRGLRNAEEIAQASSKAPQNERDGMLEDYHRRRIEAIETAWTSDLAQAGVALPAAFMVLTAAATESPPSALEASAVAEPKRAMEMPVLNAISLDRRETLARATGEQVWLQLAALHPDDAQLDQATIALIRVEHPSAAVAAPLAVTKAFVESPLLRMVRNLQESIALDTVRNEYELHQQIHQWLAASPTVEIEALNERVYAELFLTPSSDPWLGLVPQDTYTALQNGGLTD